jgi:hypothetical protein
MSLVGQLLDNVVHQVTLYPRCHIQRETPKPQHSLPAIPTFSQVLHKHCQSDIFATFLDDASLWPRSLCFSMRISVRVLNKLEGSSELVNSALSFTGGVDIGATALNVLNLIWFG